MSEHGRGCLCFPCRRERKRLADLEWVESHTDLAAGLPSAKDEARALLALVQGRNGGTEKAFEEVRELIAVPPGAMCALLSYCRKHPAEREGIERVLRFRRRVAEEFEKLVAGGPEIGFDFSGAALQVVEPLKPASPKFGQPENPVFWETYQSEIPA